MPTTSWPSSSRASARCEPMKPAAPVTTYRIRTSLRRAAGDDGHDVADAVRRNRLVDAVEDALDGRRSERLCEREAERLFVLHGQAGVAQERRDIGEREVRVRELDALVTRVEPERTHG